MVDVLRQRVERIVDLRVALCDLRDERAQPRHVRSWEGDRTRLEGSIDRLEVGVIRRVLVLADPDKLLPNYRLGGTRLGAGHPEIADLWENNFLNSISN